MGGQQKEKHEASSPLHTAHATPDVGTHAQQGVSKEKKRCTHEGERALTKVLLLELAGQVTLDEGGLACESGGERCASANGSASTFFVARDAFFAPRSGGEKKKKTGAEGHRKAHLS